jgi:hypothetical protein
VDGEANENARASCVWHACGCGCVGVGVRTATPASGIARVCGGIFDGHPFARRPMDRQDRVAEGHRALNRYDHALREQAGTPPPPLPPSRSARSNLHSTPLTAPRIAWRWYIRTRSAACPAEDRARARHLARSPGPHTPRTRSPRPAGAGAGEEEGGGDLGGGHNDLVWEKTRFIFWCLFYGFIGPELAFFTPPLRGLSQKVAALILCAFKCSAPAVPMRTSKPPHIWHGESSNNHDRSHKEDGSVMF